MKRALMMALAAGAMMFATADNAEAQNFYRGRSGFNISLNYGNAGFGRGYGYGGYGGYGYSRYRSFQRVTPNAYINRSFYRGPSYGYGGFRGGYGYGGGYGCW